MFTSPEAITSTFWRRVLGTELNHLVSFVAVDEVHCVRTWGKDFRPAYQDFSFLRALFSSIPIMILSATLPPSLEFLVARDIGLRKPYVQISLPLNRSNIFYSVKKKQGLLLDMSAVVSAINRAAGFEDVPKTVIFCITKDVLQHLCSFVEEC